MNTGNIFFGESFNYDPSTNVISSKDGKMKINANGTLEATDGNFSGTVNATSGTFNGTVNATSGIFNGTVNATSLKIGTTDLSFESQNIDDYIQKDALYLLGSFPNYVESYPKVPQFETLITVEYGGQLGYFTFSYSPVFTAKTVSPITIPIGTGTMKLGNSSTNALVFEYGYTQSYANANVPYVKFTTINSTLTNRVRMAWTTKLWN